MSIGIMSDLELRVPSGAAEEVRFAVPDREMQSSKIETCFDCKTPERGGASGINANEMEQAEALEHVSSPWVTTKSFKQKASNPETLCWVKEASNLKSNKGRRKKLGGVKGPTIEHTVKFFSTQTPNLQSGCDNRKFDRFKGRMKKGEGGSSQREGDFTFATPQGASALDKEVMEDRTTDNITETLRMNLWEILGKVSSPKSPPSNSLVCNVGSDMLKPARIVEQKGGIIVESRQQPGTIEADTENPYCTMKGPVTFSLTRKRTSTEKQLGKTKADPTSFGREKFIFDGEDLFRKGPTAATGGFSLSMQKNGQIKSMCIKPRKILFTEDNNVDNQGETHMSEISAPAVKTFPAGNRMGNFSGFDTMNYNESPGVTDKNQEMVSYPPSRGTSHQSLGTPRKQKQGSSDSPATPDNRYQQEDSTDHFQSPTMKINSPTLCSVPCSTPKTKQLNLKYRSPEQAERVFMIGNIRSFRTMQHLKVNLLATNAQTETEYETVQPEESVLPRQKQKYVECFLTESSSELGNPHSSKGGSRMNKVSSGRDCIPQPSQQIDEDLQRVVMHVALALENYKRQMRLATKKKSCDILMSVSEDINEELQTVESQIQTDLGKLTNLSKSKRKRLEGRFHEQQEQLMFIHKNFKADIHQHLNDFKSTLEELEVHQSELKGVLKSQKASHQKLLVQAQEAIERKLNDAQRRITEVQKSAREKMTQLRRCVAECLNEGILS